MQRIVELEPGLALHLRLLDEPCLWSWELRAPGGRILESSWATQWVAFVSRDDAEAAGRRRLAELAMARRPGARAPATRPTVRRAG